MWFYCSNLRCSSSCRFLQQLRNRCCSCCFILQHLRNSKPLRHNTYSRSSFPKLPTPTFVPSQQLLQLSSNESNDKSSPDFGGLFLCAWGLCQPRRQVPELRRFAPRCRLTIVHWVLSPAFFSTPSPREGQPRSGWGGLLRLIGFVLPHLS